MRSLQISLNLMLSCFLSGFLLICAEGTQSKAMSAQFKTLTLATGFVPDPTILRGQGGGDRRAIEVVKTRQTPTGPCLGYISRDPHEEITLADEFSNLEMRVESALDTTLIVEGPGGIWCNDDSRGNHNPEIAGEWLPGIYRVWIGAYLSNEAPMYRLYIRDKS